MVGCGGLVEVARAIQLVQSQKVPELQIGVVELNERINVSVGLLGCSDELDDLVDELFDLGDRALSHSVGAGLQPLVYVAVVEIESDEFSLFKARRAPEVHQASRLDELIVFVLQRALGESLQSARPKRVGHPDLAKGNRVAAALEAHSRIPVWSPQPSACHGCGAFGVADRPSGSGACSSARLHSPRQAGVPHRNRSDFRRPVPQGRVTRSKGRRRGL